MTQGTISIIFGCHSPVHSILVLLAWRKIYGKWPKFWETVCILIHDIGHYGLNYLDDVKQKRKHWRPGAEIAWRLFGMKGFLLLAGHCLYSGFKKSTLYRADKYAWVIAPNWWLYSNNFFEPKLCMGYGRMEAVKLFKESVTQNWNAGLPESTHDLYLKRCKGRQ